MGKRLKHTSRTGLSLQRAWPFSWRSEEYVQYKVLEDAKMLAAMLKNHKGVLYLCGCFIVLLPGKYEDTQSVRVFWHVLTHLQVYRSALCIGMHV